MLNLTPDFNTPMLIFITNWEKIKANGLINFSQTLTLALYSDKLLKL